MKFLCRIFVLVVASVLSSTSAFGPPAFDINQYNFNTNAIEDKLNVKTVYLTFNNAPSIGTFYVLKALEKADVTAATFGINSGENIKKSDEVRAFRFQILKFIALKKMMIADNGVYPTDTNKIKPTFETENFGHDYYFRGLAKLEILSAEIIEHMKESFDKYATIPYYAHWNMPRTSQYNEVKSLCRRCLHNWDDTQSTIALSKELAEEKKMTVFGFDITLEPENFEVANYQAHLRKSLHRLLTKEKLVIMIDTQKVTEANSEQLYELLSHMKGKGFSFKTMDKYNLKEAK